MLYELATLTIAIGSAPKAAAAVDAFVTDPAAKGRLLGCFTSDIGALNQMFVLRAFDNAADVQTERLRVLHSANPFNCSDVMSRFTVETHAPFPFLPPVKTGSYGGVYEIRQYTIKNGGLPPSFALWEKFLPERIKLSPLIIGMYALDGEPRIAHIWPYADIGTRGKTRAAAVAAGVWPPVGGPAWLGEMRTTITIPTANSPLK